MPTVEDLNVGDIFRIPSDKDDAWYLITVQGIVGIGEKEGPTLPIEAEEFYGVELEVLHRAGNRWRYGEPITKKFDYDV